MSALTAIHVRTGQRASADVLEAWLARGGVEVLSFDDVYAACIHLLRCYERIPDLALVGTDWLGADELRIVTYIRQTWPQAGIIVYAANADAPDVQLVPLTLSCRGEQAVATLCRTPPEEVLHKLRGGVPALAALTRVPEPAGLFDRQADALERPNGARTCAGAGQRRPSATELDSLVHGPTGE